ncbi:MAG: AAA family ATPase, partial [Planctomycetales bacterium]|nr:AAA family ATPase [Planctomycetales bacterium]
MKITDLQVDGFGVWNELTIDDLSPEMTVFFGRNEAGKTTLMQFIRSGL